MQLQTSLSDIAEKLALLDFQSFQNFLANVHRIRAMQQTPTVSKEEEALLRKINRGFPSSKWERLDFLDTKLESATALSAEEQKELKALTDAYERYTVIRLKNIGKLAELRKTTLREVMKQLGIRHESDV